MNVTASSLAAIRARLHDPSLTALLAVQVLITFVVLPATAAGFHLPSSVPLALLLTVMCIVIFMAHGRWTMFAGIGLLAASFAFAFFERGVPGLASRVVVAVTNFLTYATLSLLVARAVFGPGPVSSHRIRGAIVLYLNVGLMFASIDRILAETLPDSYHGLPPLSDPPALNAAMTYFSFTTLTTIGYGDIIPVHPIARSIATLEGIIGLLYPATLLARIVTSEAETRRERQSRKQHPKPPGEE